MHPSSPAAKLSSNISRAVPDRILEDDEFEGARSRDVILK